MLRSSLIAAGAVILGGSAAAQSLDSTVHAITSPVKHAGIYHVASGTWTRNVPTSVGLGPDIVYNNTANSGFYSDLNFDVETESFEIIDEGRIPSISSGVAGVDRDFYTVNCIDVGYCVGEDSTATGALTMNVNLYNSYLPCGDQTNGVLAGGFTSAALPGTAPANVGNATAVSCWIVQFDLTGTEICVAGDGEGVNDGDADFDSFGIGYEFDPGGAGGFLTNISVGPILGGDRNWTIQAPGEYLAAGLAGGGGGGTYFGPAETCLDPANPLNPNSSGYDNQDFLFSGFGASSTLGAGCYWFQGYNNTLACNADGSANTAGVFTNSHAGTYAVLYADATPTCDIGPGDMVTFCDPNNANSTGSPAQLSSSIITPPSANHTDLHLDVSGGPAGEFGYFLVGEGFNETTPISLGNGLLCLNAPGAIIARYNVSGAGSLINSVGQFDANGDIVNIVGTATSNAGALGFDVPVDLPNPLPMIMSGETWHFQCWYRDTPAGPGQSNLSNGLSHTF